MRFFKSSVAVAALCVAGAANAAIIHETFNLYDSTLTYGGIYNSLTFTGSQGSTVTVTAGYYPSYIQDASGATSVQYWGGYGLGAGDEAPSPDHAVDGDNGNEVLFFTFDWAVDLLKVEFGYEAGTSFFDLYGSDQGTTAIDIPVSLGYVDVSSYGKSGTTIGIGAYYADSAFKVDGLKVSYDDGGEVPLPASAWLLLAGLGGMGAMKRRRKAA